jgi:hypothetical protein
MAQRQKRSISRTRDRFRLICGMARAKRWGANHGASYTGTSHVLKDALTFNTLHDRA